MDAIGLRFVILNTNTFTIFIRVGSSTLEGGINQSNSFLAASHNNCNSFL